VLIEIVKSKENAFEKLEKHFKPFMLKTIQPFLNDKSLMLVESRESLYNICLLKLNEAIEDFIYEDSLTPIDNEKRFVSMVVTYIRNILVDQQYAINLQKRKPKMAFIRIDDGFLETKEEIDQIDIEDKKVCNVVQIAFVGEVIENLKKKLDKMSFDIVMCLLNGYNVEGVAGQIGISITKTRNILYNKIQPIARKYVQ